MRNFRTLNIWKHGIHFTSKIYDISRQFPKAETYGLTSQIRRAIVSVPSNIAEGCGRNSDKETARFVEIAISSAFEVETQLILSGNQGYINPSTLATMLEELHVLQRQMNAYRLSLLK